jgi:hypothetical protein
VIVPLCTIEENPRAAVQPGDLPARPPNAAAYGRQRNRFSREHWSQERSVLLDIGRSGEARKFHVRDDRLLPVMYPVASIMKFTEVITPFWQPKAVMMRCHIPSASQTYVECTSWLAQERTLVPSERV